MRTIHFLVIYKCVWCNIVINPSITALWCHLFITIVKNYAYKIIMIINESVKCVTIT